LGASWSGLESEAAPGKGSEKKEFEEFKELQEFKEETLRGGSASQGVSCEDP